MRLFLLILLTAAYVNAQAEAAPKYPASAIPEELKKNADAVKRIEDIVFTINKTNETFLRKKYAITVLNEKGERTAILHEYYDKLMEIKSISGTLYDASGAVIKTMKTKDAIDLSATDDNNLIDDSRRKVFQFSYKNYPYTVEFEVEIKFNNTLFFPVWVPQDEEKMSVEEGMYTIICPWDYDVRYKAFNYAGEPTVIQNEKGKKILKWEVKKMLAIKAMFASPTLRERTTMIYFAPSQFEIQGHKGNMSTWKDFGMFQISLNKGRDRLSDKMINKVQELTSGVSDDKEKVRILYKYLQQNTRYISIQLGLGGWQPFEADYVAQKAYGDCKALTNFMHSILKTAGIKSNYTLINSGVKRDNLIEDFPMNRFNHVILTVPFEKDTMWLECTSQILPAGYIGEGNANRHALMIDENGGVVVPTPIYGVKEILQIRTIKATLNDNGDLKMKVNTKYSGVQQDRVHYMINALSKDKLHKILQEEYALNTSVVNDFKYKEDHSALPSVEETLDITVSGYANISGKRIFIHPNILNKSTFKIPEEEERKDDYVFTFAYYDEDVVEIELPEGYEIEAAMPDVVLKTKFGTYTSSAKLVGNKIFYKRTIEKNAGRFSVSEAAEMTKFFNDIFKADRGRMVLVKK